MSLTCSMSWSLKRSFWLRVSPSMMDIGIFYMVYDGREAAIKDGNMEYILFGEYSRVYVRCSIVYSRIVGLIGVRV